MKKIMEMVAEEGGGRKRKEEGGRRRRREETKPSTEPQTRGEEKHFQSHVEESLSPLVRQIGRLTSERIVAVL